MTPSTVTIKLPKDLYTRLEGLAKQARTDLVERLDRLATSGATWQSQAELSTAAFRRILDRATDLGVSDLAEQHDHHLYGAEKQ